MTLNERLGALADTMRANQHLMLRIAESQTALGPALQRLAEQQGGDEISRGHLRNIDIYLAAAADGNRTGPLPRHRGPAQRSAVADPHGRRPGRTAAVAGHGRAHPQARRQRTGGMARLCGRAVHPADGHHLRPAGVRSGAGVPDAWRCPAAATNWTRRTSSLTALADALSLERGKSADLQVSVSQLGKELSARSSERDRLTSQLADANLAVQAATVANARLQSQLTDTSRRQANAAKAQLADAQNQLAEMKKQIADLDRTVAVDKDTLQAKLSDLATLANQTRALAALRDELEKQAQDAAARAMTEQQRRQAVRGAARRREEARRQRPRPDRAAEPADRPVESPAFLDRVQPATDAAAKQGRRTSRSPTSARG